MSEQPRNEQTSAQQSPLPPVEKKSLPIEQLLAARPKAVAMPVPPKLEEPVANSQMTVRHPSSETTRAVRAITPHPLADGFAAVKTSIPAVPTAHGGSIPARSSGPLNRGPSDPVQQQTPVLRPNRGLLNSPLLRNAIEESTVQSKTAKAEASFPPRKPAAASVASIFNREPKTNADSIMGRKVPWTAVMDGAIAVLMVTYFGVLFSWVFNMNRSLEASLRYQPPTDAEKALAATRARKAAEIARELASSKSNDFKLRGLPSFDTHAADRQDADNAMRSLGSKSSSNGGTVDTGSVQSESGRIGETSAVVNPVGSGKPAGSINPSANTNSAAGSGGTSRNELSQVARPKSERAASAGTTERTKRIAAASTATEAVVDGDGRPINPVSETVVSVNPSSSAERKTTRHKTVADDSDVARYHQLLAGYFTRRRTQSAWPGEEQAQGEDAAGPPSLKEWLEMGRPEF